MQKRTYDSSHRNIGEFFDDVKQSLHRAGLWWALARQDIRNRYRRSYIGPFWITISMAFLILGLGPLYSTLFKQDLSKFLPHIALGIIFWDFMSSSINDASASLYNSGGLLRSSRFPLGVPIFRSVSRSLIILAHNLLVFIPVMIYTRSPINANWLLVIPGIILVSLLIVTFAYTTSIVSARYRDFESALRSVMQVMFFVSPIVWGRQLLPAEYAWVNDYNPFAAGLDVLRTPLMGEVPALWSYQYLAMLLLAGVLLATAIVMWGKPRINYWL